LLQNNAKVGSIVAVVGIVLALRSASGYVAAFIPRRERRSARHAVSRRRN